MLDVYSNYTPGIGNPVILRYPNIEIARKNMPRRTALYVKKDIYLCYIQRRIQHKGRNCLADSCLGYLNTDDAVRWVRFGELAGVTPSYSKQF